MQGAVNPDEFYVYKPALAAGKRPILRKNLGSKAIKMIYSDDPEPGKTVDTVDVDETDSRRLLLQRRRRYLNWRRWRSPLKSIIKRPMDIEWGKDGNDGKLYILQARPETVQSRSGRAIQRYTLKQSLRHYDGPQHRPKDWRR